MNDKPEVSAMRISYELDELNEADLASNPLEQFTQWMNDATEHPDILEPNAMVLSTVNPQGVPSSRSVLLKGVDHRGLTFYTNYGSTKATHIADNNNVSVVFPWYSLHRQIIVLGTASKVSREESQAYFDTRPHMSKLGAIVSAQSTLIDSRDVLEKRMAELIAEFPEDTHVPLPDQWGGFLITVNTMEFWQGRRSRLHDRLRFIAIADSHDISESHAWRVQRYSP